MSQSSVWGIKGPVPSSLCAGGDLDSWRCPSVSDEPNRLVHVKRAAVHRRHCRTRPAVTSGVPQVQPLTGGHRASRAIAALSYSSLPRICLSVKVPIPVPAVQLSSIIHYACCYYALYMLILQMKNKKI